MALERVRNGALPNAVSDVVADLADLFQKELRLARAEIADKIASKLQASVWMSAGGVLGLIAVVFGLQAGVFGLASYGIPMHWSFLIVAGVIAAIAAIAFFKGRSDAKEELTPSRTIKQIKRDISTVKEQLT